MYWYVRTDHEHDAHSSCTVRGLAHDDQLANMALKNTVSMSRAIVVDAPERNLHGADAEKLPSPCSTMVSAPKPTRLIDRRKQTYRTCTALCIRPSRRSTGARRAGRTRGPLVCQSRPARNPTVVTCGRCHIAHPMNHYYNYKC